MNNSYRVMEDFTLNIWRLHPSGIRIIPAEKTLNGTAHPEGVKFCGPFTTANKAGFWAFPPADIDICWTGESFEHRIISNYSGVDHEFVKQLVQRKDGVNPEDFCPAGGRSKYTWGAVENNIVQIWTGCIFETPPGWGLHIRSPINFPPRSCYVMEGILETDWMQYDIWINLVFTKQGEWIKLRREEWPPLAQLIPVQRSPEWKINKDQLVNREEEDANRAFEYWIQYNHKKYSSGGKQMLTQERQKDSTTYHKERQRILDKKTLLPVQKEITGSGCPSQPKKIKNHFIRNI